MYFLKLLSSFFQLDGQSFSRSLSHFLAVHSLTVSAGLSVAAVASTSRATSMAAAFAAAMSSCGMRGSSGTNGRRPLGSLTRACQ
jgi:hypothetical protein